LPAREQPSRSIFRRAPKNCSARLKLPVLLLTGYGGALLAERAARAGIARVLTKPVQYAELAAALALLAGGPGG